MDSVDSVPGHNDYEEHPNHTFPHKLKHLGHHIWHGWHFLHNVIAGYGLAEAANHVRETVADTKFFGHGS